MLLSQQQKEMLDNPSGYIASQNNKKTVSNNISNEDLFKQMDKDMAGLGYNFNPQPEKTIKEVLIQEDPDKAKQYESMGEIGLYEGAKREAFEFSGKYDNVVLHPSQVIAQENFRKKQEEINQKRAERNKRVNEGTATFNERVDAFFDRMAQSNIKDSEARFSQNAYNQNVGEPNTRTRVAGVSRTGQIIYDNVDLTKKIGFLEAFRTALPEGTAVGSFAKGFDDKKIREIKQKMIEDKPIYKDELDFINQHYEAEKEKQLRGYSIGGQIGGGVGKSLGFAADFIVGGAALKALGVGALAGNAGLKTYLGAKELGASSAIAKGLAKTAELGVNGLLGSAVMTAVNAPLRLFPEYQERMLGNEAKLTDNGNMIFQESDEKPATALMKSLSGLYFSYLTELIGGEALRGITNVLAKPIGNVAGGAVGRMLSANPALKNFLTKSTTELAKRYEQLRGLPVIGKSTGWIKDTVHFDGFLEEMGEEALEDVLRLTFEIDNEERNFDNYVKAIFKTPEEWAIIAGTIALQGAGLSAVGYAVSKNMANAGASEEEIVDVISNSTEAQKKQILNEQIANGMADIPSEINQNEINKNIIKANYENLSEEELNIEVKRDEIEENVYNKLLKGRVSEDVAAANAKLFGQFFKKFGAKNEQTQKAFEDWINKFDVQYDVPVEQMTSMFQGANVAGVNNNSEIEEAKKEWQEKGVESKYFKQWFGDSKVVDESGKPLVVYHGSIENNINEFDLSYARNENAFFFTDNKNVATDYAKEYEETNDNISGKVYPVYLSMNNPYIVDAKGKTYSQYYSQLQNDFSGLKEAGYDGIIIKNIKDNKWNNTKPELSNVYAVLNPNQIKSVDNQGTFDSNNPNIYYQNIFKDVYNVVKDVFLKGDSARVSELFDYIPELQPLKDYFKDELKDVKFREMPKWMQDNDDTLGGHLSLWNKNTIYFNYKKIESYPNKEQQFFRTLLHELMHAKQHNLLMYAKKNIVNKMFSEADKEALKQFLDINKKSINATRKYKEFTNKYTLSDVKNNKKLEQQYIKVHNEYENAYMETDADNVALALLARIGKTNNAILRSYLSDIESSEAQYRATVHQRPLAEIYAFIDRLHKNENNVSKRLSQIINTKTFFQSAQNFDINSNIENNFGDSIENITEGIRADIQNILDENNVSPEEFDINDIRIYGSYTTGQNKNTSDLDFLVEYSGTMREDDAFNMFSDAGLKLTDINGNEVNVDINPIRKDKSGTIDEFLERNKDYKNSQKDIIRTLFQSNNVQNNNILNLLNSNYDNSIYYDKEIELPESEKETVKQYKNIVNKIFDKTITPKEQARGILIGNTPEKLIQAGLSKLPIRTKYDVIYDAHFGARKSDGTINKKGHQLSIDILRDIPELLQNPIIVMDSLTEENSVVVFVDAYDKDANNNDIPVMLAIEMDRNIGKRNSTYLVNSIRSIYSRNNYENLIERTILDKDKNIRKVDKNKIQDLLNKAPTVQSHRRGVNPATNIIPQISENKTVYQETDNEQRIAGYTYPEVMDKLTEIYTEMENLSESDSRISELMAQAHILEDAFEVASNPDNFEENAAQEIMLNAYYVMNNQKLPDGFIEDDSASTRTYADLKKIHEEKKEQAEREYYGYFTEGQDKNIITIMANSDASTALHELGHLFLNGLNELAKVNEDAKKQLEAFNKWLGYTGGEYTVSQQEKFARSFEAYLYNGKAPNSKLKTVFENFKEWLKSVYDYIVNIPEADISDEVQELFDKMFADDGYYQEKKQAKDLLNKVKKVSSKQKVAKVATKNDSELDDYAKRHKEASYQILSVATGKSINYLKSIFETGSNNKGTAKKRENIQFLLDKVEDQITTSGGMRDEWKEFYADTGVNYDTDTVGSDYKLAEAALYTILNKSYRSDNFESEADERAEYYARIIDDAERQYKVLLKSFEKENRNVALSAFYEWIEGLDSTIRSDFESRFIFDSNQIERNENLNKFEKAKREIIRKALELDNGRSISENEKYKELVKEIVKELNFLQPLDKAKLTTNILDVPSTGLLMARIDDIMDMAKTMEDIAYRRNLETQIHKELQKTKNIKKNGRTVGKYDYRSNKIFEELRELDKLKPEQANELRLEMSKFSSAEDNGLSYKDKVINKFLSYKANGRMYADTDLTKELYDEIIKIKLIGKSAKSELDLQEKLSEGKDIDELINIVENKKDAGIFKKNYISWLGNLESTINAIFNRKIKEKYASEILYAETQAQAWQHQIKTKFEEGVAKIYNLPIWAWDKKILEYLAEKHTYSEIRRKYDENGDLVKVRNIDRTLTKMDIIQAYIWSKNEILEKRLINQFGEDVLDNMFDELSLQDVQFAELMMETAQSFYPMVNKAFIKKYGLDLPKVSCYFPSTPERGSEVDLYNEYSSKSLNNSFTKARAQSETVAMDFHNPVATLYSHIEGVAKFAFMSESLDRANLRFKDNDLKRAIINKFGEDVYKTLEQNLINVTYKKEATVFNGVNKILDNMIGNWIQANIAIKPIVGLKQLLSANNYAVDMPYLTWQNGFLKALAHPKETIDYMMNIPYIKARFEGNFSNEYLKAQIENSAFATSKKLKDLCTLFVKMGDIGAIIFGGKPYIDYLINEKGLEEDEAIKQFILSTNRSQQSSAISSLSNFQVYMTRNAVGKLFIAFKNSPQQYIRMCGDAIISATNGDISKKQAAKLLFQFGYLQPFLYAMATSGSLLTWMFAGDDDDLIKDLSISIFNLGSDSLPIVGDIYKYIINKRLYKEKNLPATTPLVGDIEKEINRISKDDVSVSDYIEAIGYLGLHVGLGYNSKAISNMASGVGDMFTGEPVQGSMKILGYTKKRAEHIAGND